jgi:hypothetical protein
MGDGRRNKSRVGYAHQFRFVAHADSRPVDRRAGYGRSGKPLGSERPGARNAFMSTKGWLILAAANLPVY